MYSMTLFFFFSSDFRTLDEILCAIIQFHVKQSYNSSLSEFWAEFELLFLAPRKKEVVLCDFFFRFRTFSKEFQEFQIQLSQYVFDFNSWVRQLEHRVVGVATQGGLNWT